MVNVMLTTNVALEVYFSSISDDMPLPTPGEAHGLAALQSRHFIDHAAIHAG
jgi:hypothetical protein